MSSIQSPYKQFLIFWVEKLLRPKPQKLSFTKKGQTFYIVKIMILIRVT